MYSVTYINCRVCGSDKPKFLGIRGNREFAGAENTAQPQAHMVTNVVRCKKCGFVYTNPFIAFDTGAYSDADAYLPSSSVGADALFKNTLRLIAKSANKGRILDVGCGKGEFLSIAKQNGWETHGVEPSVNLAKFASEKYGVNVKCGSLDKTAYPDDFFDAIVLNMVLEHMDDPNKNLTEIRRVLKKEGMIFIEVPNTDSLMLKLAAAYFKVKGKGWSPLLSPLHYPFHCYGYNPRSLDYLLRARGFYIKRMFIRDSSLRGFRSDTGGSALEKSIRNTATRLAGLIGKGDVLIVIAGKRKDGVSV